MKSLEAMRSALIEVNDRLEVVSIFSHSASSFLRTAEDLARFNDSIDRAIQESTSIAVRQDLRQIRTLVNESVSRRLSESEGE